MGGKKPIKIALLCILTGAIIFGAVVGASYFIAKMSFRKSFLIAKGFFSFCRFVILKTSKHSFGIFEMRYFRP